MISVEESSVADSKAGGGVDGVGGIENGN